MGLFDIFKKKPEGHCVERAEYVPARRPLPSGYGVRIDEFHPKWRDEFPDFPYEFDGRPALRTGFTERMRDVFSFAPEDAAKVEAIFERADELLASAHELAEFPRFSIPRPDLSEGGSISSFPTCWIRCIPFTEKTKRISKFPFRLEYSTGMMHCAGRPDATVELRADLFPDGTPGRIESQYAEFKRGGSFGHFWTVTAKGVKGEMVVSRIAESSPDGGMPTLYSIGR